MKEKGSNKVTYMYMYMKINGHVHMYVTLSAHEYVNVKGFQK